MDKSSFIEYLWANYALRVPEVPLFNITLTQAFSFAITYNSHPIESYSPAVIFRERLRTWLNFLKEPFQQDAEYCERSGMIPYSGYDDNLNLPHGSTYKELKHLMNRLEAILSQAE